MVKAKGMDYISSLTFLLQEPFPPRTIEFFLVPNLLFSIFSNLTRSFGDNVKS